MKLPARAGIWEAACIADAVLGERRKAHVLEQGIVAGKVGCLDYLPHAAWPGSQFEQGAGKRAGAAQAWPSITWEQTGAQTRLTWAHHSPGVSVDGSRHEQRSSAQQCCAAAHMGWPLGAVARAASSWYKAVCWPTCGVKQWGQEAQ